MKNESRLGVGLKGLSTFFDDSGEAQKALVSVNPASGIPQNGEIIYLPVSNIQTTPNQPRKRFDEEALGTLAKSIKTEGLLQPVLVRKRASNLFEIVAGERRLRAAKIAGIREIPAIVKDLNDEKVFQIALIENLQRENLSPLEEAQGYKRLLDDFGYKQKDVADLVHKSRPYVANILRLLTLPKSVQQMVDEGKITYSAAIGLTGNPNAEKEAAAIVEKVKAPSRAAAPEGLKADLKQIQESLSRVLATNVRINCAGGKGSVSISFKDMETLDRILKKLTAM